MEHLTQEELKKMMLFSFEKVKENEQEINKINVFPVPDQDTGTNLVKTLEGIKEVIESKEFESLDDFSKATLDGALTTAQGNAGIIYTGFLAGFLPALQGKNPVNIEKLAKAMKEGALRARRSIQNPKQGTILDVIDAASESMEENVGKEEDMINIFKQAVDKASKALIATQEKLDVLKKAKVVDAGGMGYLVILESYLESLQKEPSLIKKEEKAEKSSEKIKRFIQVISNRYEVVCLIENLKFEEEVIRKKLNKLGNSLDIVQVEDKMKIHIHTDSPDKVKEIMRGLGKILSLREEDMSKEVVGEESVKKVSIGIVTDDLADLNQKIIERYQIEVVPYKINWPGGEDISGENIYQKMEEADKRGLKDLPKTSQASPREFLDAYQRQLEKFSQVLCIPLSSALSGGYNSAIQARSMMEDPSKVYVLDSLQISAGQALLVLRAIELIQEQREIREVIAELKRTIPSIYVFGFIADPKWAERGGRVSSSQAKWMKRLQGFGMRPLMGLKHGQVKKLGFRFGAKEIYEALFKEIESKSKEARKKGKIRVVITHCDNLEEAQKLKDKLKEIKAEVSFINLAGSVLGVHVGPKSLIAGWTKRI